MITNKNLGEIIDKPFLSELIIMQENAESVINFDWGSVEKWKIVRALEAYERLKKLQTHPYNFGERIMEGLQFEIEGKTKFRQLLAGLIFTELQKILDGKK